MSNYVPRDSRADPVEVPYVDIISTAAHITRFLTRRDGSLPAEDLPDMLEKAGSGAEQIFEDDQHRYELRGCDSQDGRISLKVFSRQPEPEPDPELVVVADDDYPEPM